MNTTQVTTRQSDYVFLMGFIVTIFLIVLSYLALKTGIGHFNQTSDDANTTPPVSQYVEYV